MFSINQRKPVAQYNHVQIFYNKCYGDKKLNEYLLFI